MVHDECLEGKPPPLSRQVAADLGCLVGRRALQPNDLMPAGGYQVREIADCPPSGEPGLDAAAFEFGGQSEAAHNVSRPDDFRRIGPEEHPAWLQATGLRSYPRHPARHASVTLSSAVTTSSTSRSVIAENSGRVSSRSYADSATGRLPASSG